MVRVVVTQVIGCRLMETKYRIRAHHKQRMHGSCWFIVELCLVMLMMDERRQWTRLGGRMMRILKMTIVKMVNRREW